MQCLYSAEGALECDCTETFETFTSSQPKCAGAHSGSCPPDQKCLRGLGDGKFACAKACSRTTMGYCPARDSVCVVKNDMYSCRQACEGCQLGEMCQEVRDGKDTAHSYQCVPDNGK